jgi:hypothetical protein
MGAEHGAYCLGCCWFLMALLFVGGVMNLIWVAGIAVYVALEKMLPGACRAGHVCGLSEQSESSRCVIEICASGLSSKLREGQLRVIRDQVEPAASPAMSAMARQRPNSSAQRHVAKGQKATLSQNRPRPL